MANSALFGVAKEIKTVQNAVVILGLDFIKALAVTVGMRSYVKSAMRIPILRSCWHHSVATALLSRELATASRASGDEAYTAGLLHDIGRIGLMASYPPAYANMLSVSYEYSFDVMEFERDLFDIDHCEAGAWLAEEWGLPKTIALVAQHHHEEPVPHKVDILNFVALGCRLADTLGFSVTGGSRVWTLEEVHACLPESAQVRFHPDAENLKARVTAHIEALG